MIIDGRKLAQQIEREIKDELSAQAQKKVAFVMFQNTPQIEQFVNMKMKTGTRLGVDCSILKFEGEIKNENAIKFLDEIINKNYDGIVVQLPIPKELDIDLILNKIPINLDIDVLGEEVIKKYLSNESSFVPPIAKAINEILKFTKINLLDKKVLIIGNGRLVGQVASYYFTKEKIPFDIITEKTEGGIYSEKIKNADIIISGVGSPHFIKKEKIKEGVIIIDAGTSEKEGSLVGDIHPDCESVASFITPVPGGVGPLAVISLFKNLIS